MDLTKLVARGQITIVDLNDATALQVWLENNSADVQVYNSDKDTYTPDYTKTNVVITPKVYLSGSSTEQIGAGHVSNIKYKIVGIAADGTYGQLVDSTSFVINTTNGTLTIKKNLVEFQSLNITMTIVVLHLLQLLFRHRLLLLSLLLLLHYLMCRFILVDLRLINRHRVRTHLLHLLQLLLMVV